MDRGDEAARNNHYQHHHQHNNHNQHYSHSHHNNTNNASNRQQQNDDRHKFRDNKNTKRNNQPNQPRNNIFDNRRPQAANSTNTSRSSSSNSSNGGNPSGSASGVVASTYGQANHASKDAHQASNNNSSSDICDQSQARLQQQQNYHVPFQAGVPNPAMFMRQHPARPPPTMFMLPPSQYPMHAPPISFHPQMPMQYFMPSPAGMFMHPGLVYPQHSPQQQQIPNQLSQQPPPQNHAPIPQYMMVNQQFTTPLPQPPLPIPPAPVYGLPALNCQSSQGMIPSAPYYQLPVGLMMPPIPPNKTDHQPLNPSKQHGLPVLEPTKPQPIKSIDTFYKDSQSSDSADWNDSANKSFQKAKLETITESKD